MTNKEAKQKAIEKAYGEHWDMVKDFPISEDGCVRLFNDNPIVEKAKLSCMNIHSRLEAWYCPFSIADLHYNNGWTRIEPDGSNLPDKNGLFEMCKRLEDGSWHVSYDEVHACDLREYIAEFKFTHYKEIEEELMPIY